MNSNTASASSALPGALKSAAVAAPRSDHQKSLASSSASKGDFQRLLNQAAEKKAVDKRQQLKQTEHQRLESQRLEKQRLDSQQAEAQRAEADQAQAQQLEARQQKDLQAARQGEAALSVHGDGETPSEVLVELATKPESAPPEALSETLVEAPAGGVAAPDQAQDQSTVEGKPSSVSVSLEDIAKAVSEFTGMEVLLAGAAAQGGAITSTSPAGFFNPSQAAAYGRPSSPAGAVGQTNPQGFNPVGGANVRSATTASAAMAAMAGAAESAVSAGQLTALNPDSATESFRETFREAGQGSAVAAWGQPGDGKSAPLTPNAVAQGAAPQGAGQFNLRGGLGQPEWHNAIAERIAVMATKNLTSAEIQLDPPELGQLLVRVTLNQEQVSVNFASQNAAVREALDQTAYRLRDMFEGEGLNLVDVDVSDQSFQGRQQGSAAGSQGTAGEPAEGDLGEPTVVKLGQGLIDQFV